MALHLVFQYRIDEAAVPSTDVLAGTLATTLKSEIARVLGVSVNDVDTVDAFLDDEATAISEA